MKTRGVALILAILLGVAAMTSVYLYVQGVKDKATTAPEQVTVVVPKNDIAAGTNMDDLIASGSFSTIEVPRNAIVQGAVTQLSQLEHTTTSYPILQGEQISTLRLQGFQEQPPGGILGIPAGFEAVSLPFEIPQSVGGVIQRGDHITVYGTFTDVTVLSTTLAEIFAGQAPADQSKQEVGDFTVTLVADVMVLKVATPDVNAPGSSADPVVLTLALTPTDAQNVIFAQEQGTVWLALLPPNQEGTSVPPSNVVDILLERIK